MRLGYNDIDPLSVCFYNACMNLNCTGFFRPDHDPPQAFSASVSPYSFSD